MQETNKSKYLWYLLFFALIAYLLANTGIISDDFTYTAEIKTRDLRDNLMPWGGWLSTPLEYYTHYLWYYLFDINELLFANLLKILYIFLSFYLVSKFFRIYLGLELALLVSFLFIFFPSHDATVYWFLGQYLTLVIALYLYSFYLAHKEKLLPAFLVAAFASFMSYGSPPIALALFMLFALNKEFKKGLVLLIPNIAYSFYFVFLTRFLGKGVPRISEVIDIGLITKRFALQILTFIDAMFGPSMWLKIYYSFFQISLVSLSIGVLLVIIFYKTCRRESPGYNSRLVLSLITVTFLSFAFLALTGLLPQLAFNMGNRTTTYGSLLLAYVIVLLHIPKKIRVVILMVIIFAILGISDHWKAWNAHEQIVMQNIKNNQALKNYSDDRLIYVSGNQYSKYGEISHIEFFAQPEAVDSLFNLLLKRDVPACSLNKTFKYANGYLIDTKFKRKARVRGYINVYDSEKDIFFRLDAKNINKYIDSLPPDNRHWVQIWNVRFIKNLAAKLMPRLEYAL